MIGCINNSWADLKQLLDLTLIMDKQMESAVRAFWERGYMVLPNAVSPQIISQLLELVESFTYDLIFKAVYDVERDENHLQSPSVTTGRPAVSLMKKEPNAFVAHANIRWQAKNWVILKRLPGGGSIIIFLGRNWPGTRSPLYNPGWVEAWVQENTKLIVYEGCFSEVVAQKRKFVRFGAGDCIVFRGDLVHAGATYETTIFLFTQLKRSRAFTGMKKQPKLLHWRLTRWKLPLFSFYSFACPKPRKNMPAQSRSPSHCRTG